MDALKTRSEAAEWLAISARKLDQLTADGEIRCVRIDACVRYDVADLQEFAKSRKTGGPVVGD